MSATTSQVVVFRRSGEYFHLMTTTTDEFSRVLKQWRSRKGVSQLDLALMCDVSQKHISFLESRRSQPSRTMVLDICEALDVPLRERNELLLAAGFAPSYSERDLSEPEMAEINRALDMILDQQDPYPATVIDPMFNILRLNNSAARMFLFLYDVTSADQLPDIASNKLRSLIHPDGIGRHIKNWSEIAHWFLHQLRSETVSVFSSDALKSLLHELENCPGVDKQMKSFDPEQWRAPVLTVDVEKDGLNLSLFSTITTLGTPLDVTLQDLRIESYFPADAETRNFFEKIN